MDYKTPEPGKSRFLFRSGSEKDRSREVQKKVVANMHERIEDVLGKNVAWDFRLGIRRGISTFRFGGREYLLVDDDPEHLIKPADGDWCIPIFDDDTAAFNQVPEDIAVKDLLRALHAAVNEPMGI